MGLNVATTPVLPSTNRAGSHGALSLLREVQKLIDIGKSIAVVGEWNKVYQKLEPGQSAMLLVGDYSLVEGKFRTVQVVDPTQPNLWDTKGTIAITVSKPDTAVLQCTPDSPSGAPPEPKPIRLEDFNPTPASGGELP